MTQQSILPPLKTRVKSPVKKKRAKGEENLQLAVCKYIRTVFPNVIFNCDIASGMRMPIHVAARCKKMRSGRGYPDLFIAKPNGELGDMHRCCGLFIELKKEGTKLWKKNGEPASPHVAEQNEVLTALNLAGYSAVFAVGYDEAVGIIDAYLK